MVESTQEEVLIPDRDLWGDLDALLENGAQITFTPTGTAGGCHDYQQCI